MNNQQLIRQIELIIQALTEEQAKLQQGSVAFNRQQSLINNFSNALSGLRGQLGLTEKQLDRFAMAMERVGRGQQARLSFLGGTRQRVKGIQPVIQEAATQAHIETFTEPVNPAVARMEVTDEQVTRTTNQAIAKTKATWDKISKEEQKAIADYLGTTVSAIERAQAEKARASARAQEDYLKQVEQNRLRALEESAPDIQQRVQAVGQSPVEAPDDRFDAAISGKEANLSDEERILAEQERIRQEAAANFKAYQANLIQEAEAEAAANAAMRDNINKKQAVIDQERAVQKESERLQRQRDREAAAKEAWVKKMQNLDKSLPGGAAAAQNLDARARRIDPEFTREAIKSINTEGSSQITKVKYAYTTTEGVIKSATFTVDRFGKVLVDTQRRFRSFFEGIGRDAAEALKWTIAIGLIYGPLRALDSLVQTAIKNQTALADVQVTLANATQSTAEVFQAASDIAQETGESLDGVIEAYNLAYRATGAITDSTERFATANILLKDAITLSKLSTLDQAEAIDTLAAALRQIGRPLDEGQALLDKWVRVTKVANVDLTTLATSFAVVGDAAEAVGIQEDQLNAVIATIAETSISSGKEVANAARAMIAGFQTDQARKELNLLGIAVEDSTGKIRPFLDIVADIREAREAGLITDTQFSKLTLDVGGGSRRQATVSSFISSSEKVAKIQEESSRAQGDAAEALATKLETVQTAVTRLGNAFQGLAQAVGESGGVLDVFTALANVMTVLVKGISDVMTVAGRSGPILATTLAALAYLNLGVGSSNKARLANSVGNIGTRLGYTLAKARGITDLPDQSYSAYQTGRAFQKYLPAAVGVGTTLAAAGQNLAEGRQAQAVGNVTGATIAGVIGAALGGPTGVLIGTTIGSTIGESFVDYVESYKTTFIDIFSEAFTQAVVPPPTSGEGGLKGREQALIDRLQDVAGYDTGIEGLDTFLDKFGNTIDNWGIGLATAIGNLGKPANQRTTFNGVNDTQSLLIRLQVMRDQGAISKQDYDQIIAEIRKIQELRGDKPEPASAETPKLLEDLRKQRENELRQLLQTGQIGTAPYRRGMEQLGGFSAAAQQFYPIAGEQLGGEQPFYEQFSNIYARGTDANIEELTTLRQNYLDIKSALDEAEKGTASYITLSQQMGDAADDLASRINELNNAILSQAELLQEVNLTGYTLSAGTSLQTIEDLGREIDKAGLQRQVDAGQITQEQMQAIIESTKNTLIALGDTFEVAENVSVDAINQAISQLEEQQKLIKESTDKLGFQTFDMTSSEFQGLINGPEYDKILNQLVDFGYQPENTEMINITNDGISKDRKDWKIVQLLLQSILKAEEKQLEGMYNLPEGSSFWIPYQAAKLFPQDSGNGALTDYLAKIADNTAATAANTAVVQTAQTASQATAQTAGLTPGKQLSPGAVADPYKDVIKFARYEDQIRAFRDMEKKYAEPLGYNEDLRGRGYGQVYQEPKENTTILDKIGEWFRNLSTMGDASDYKTDMFAPMKSSSAIPQANLGQELSTALGQVFSNLSTKFDLRIESRTVVQVDGRQVALAVKQYLRDDLLRYSGGAATRSVTAV